jgi:hypothetical protein
MTAKEDEIERLLQLVGRQMERLEDEAARAAIEALAAATNSLLTLMVMHRGREHPR